MLKLTVNDVNEKKKADIEFKKIKALNNCY